MWRARTVMVGVIAFVAGGFAARMLPTATAEQLSLLQWAYEDGRVTVHNPTEQSYLIVGYVDGVAAERTFSVDIADMAFNADGVTSYYAYPITVSPVDHFIEPFELPLPSRVQLVQGRICEPDNYCGPPGPCPACPPIHPNPLGRFEHIKYLGVLLRDR